MLERRRVLKNRALEVWCSCISRACAHISMPLWWSNNFQRSFIPHWRVGGPWGMSVRIWITFHISGREKYYLRASWMSLRIMCLPWIGRWQTRTSSTTSEIWAWYGRELRLDWVMVGAAGTWWAAPCVNVSGFLQQHLKNQVIGRCWGMHGQCLNWMILHLTWTCNSPGSTWWVDGSTVCRCGLIGGCSWYHMGRWEWKDCNWGVVVSTSSDITSIGSLVENIGSGGYVLSCVSIGYHSDSVTIISCSVGAFIACWKSVKPIWAGIWTNRVPGVTWCDVGYQWGCWGQGGCFR